MKRDIKSIAAAAIDGDRDAFGELYELYSTDMYRFALSMCRNAQDAQDAVQETVLSVYKGVSLISAPEKFKTYLFSSLSNTCKRKLSLKITSAEIVDVGAEDSALELALPVREALDGLDGVSREVLILSVVGGFRSWEIGKMMELPASTVRTKLKRALEKMRKELSL